MTLEFVGVFVAAVLVVLVVVLASLLAAPVTVRNKYAEKDEYVRTAKWIGEFRLERYRLASMLAGMFPQAPSAQKLKRLLDEYSRVGSDSDEEKWEAEFFPVFASYTAEALESASQVEAAGMHAALAVFSENENWGRDCREKYEEMRGHVESRVRSPLGKASTKAAGTEGGAYDPVGDMYAGVIDGARKPPVCIAFDAVGDEISHVFCASRFYEITDISQYPYIVEMGEDGEVRVRELPKAA